MDQQLKHGAKDVEAPGAEIEHSQCVRLLYGQRLYYRERRRIDRVWIAPDYFHDPTSLSALSTSGPGSGRGASMVRPMEGNFKYQRVPRSGLRQFERGRRLIVVIFAGGAEFTTVTSLPREVCFCVT